MHSVAILLCSVFVSCMPLLTVFSGSSADEHVPDYRELQIDYHLAFEKKLSTDYTELHELVSRTQLALEQGELTAEQQTEVRRWQHKLRSFLAFAMLARADTTSQPAAVDDMNELGERVQGLAILILDRIRSADATHIDPEAANLTFYQQVKADQHDTVEVSEQAKDSFAQALVSKMRELTAQSVRKYYRLFPFAQQDYMAICREVAAADCQHLQMQHGDDDFQEHIFTDSEQVTAAVNKTIVKLNRIITALSRLKDTNKTSFFIFKETNFDNLLVQRLYHDYEMTLFTAARRGFLPLMFAPTFRQRAGNIYLQYKGGLDLLQRFGLQKDIGYDVGDIKNPLLSEVSVTTVVRSLTEMQRTTIERWLELRQQSPQFSDKKLYQWSIVNELATAQVVLQEPQHSVVVHHLLNRYQHENRDPRTIRIIRAVTAMVEMTPFAVWPAQKLLTALFPPLAGVNLMSHVIIAATAVNFVWVGMAGAETTLTHRRWLQLERALLTGTSERRTDGMKALREFHRTRRNAVLAGSIGLPLSVPSIKYAINRIDGGKAFLIDFPAGVFSARNDFDYEGMSDLEAHEGH